jgi:hypothetical protein
MVKRGNYFKNSFGDLKSSLKFNKNILISGIYDLIFWAFVLIGATFAGGKIRKEAASLKVVNFENLLEVGLNELNSNLMVIKSFFLLMLGIILAYSIFLLFSYSFFKGLIWCKLLNKKFNKKYFFKYVLLNLIYFSPLIIIVFYVNLKQILPFIWGMFFLGILILLGIHFSAILSYNFTLENNIKKTFSNSFRKGIKLHKYIIFYFIVIGIYWILRRILPFTQGKELISSLILLIIYFMWVRNYFIKVLRGV